MAAPGIPNWQKLLLKGIGAPVTPQNLVFVNDWTRAEGGGAANNPFNTTEPGYGTTGNYNPVGVKNYATPQQGIQATEATLLNGRYGNILAALRQGTSAQQAAHALASSPWGTGSLVEKMLGAAPQAPQAPSLAQAAAAPSPAPVPTADFGAEIRQLLGNQTGGLDKTGFYGKLGSLLQRRQAQQQPATLEHPTVRSQPLPGRTTTALPFVGNVKGVKPSLLAAVSQAAKAAGATTIEVTSGARSATHNAQVGGVSHSNHLTGDAIDGYAVLADGTRVPLGQLLVKSAARYGLRSGDVPGFFNGRPDPVHVDDGANVR